jgi:glycosyltransferase involved in cell wall biosynthesis
VVIPVYNEEQCIGETLARIATHFGEQDVGWEMIVVDDGSTDATKDRVVTEMAKRSQLRVLQHASNRGNGAAAGRESSMPAGSTSF